MSACNDLKNKALTLLLKETFSHRDQNAYHDYVQLAIENKKVKGITQHGKTVFFMYQGTVYPDRTPDGLNIKTIKVNAPVLHWSLIEKLDNINKLVNSSDRITIRNFFASVLSSSFNKIVLDTFIPNILISDLRKEFSNYQYDLIDFGSETRTPFEPIEVTQQKIVEIQQHYAGAIILLKDILMERFLLQE